MDLVVGLISLWLVVRFVQLIISLMKDVFVRR